MRFLESVAPSANGEKLALGARGEVLIFDAATKETKNLTNSSGVAERYPTISPNGKSVAYFFRRIGRIRAEHSLDANEKIVGITLVIPSEQKIKDKRIN